MKKIWLQLRARRKWIPKLLEGKLQPVQPPPGNFALLAVSVIEHHVRVDIEDEDVGEVLARLEDVIDPDFGDGVQPCPSRCGCQR